MKYILIDETKTDWFTKEFDNEEEAVSTGENEWLSLSASDKKKRSGFYVLESINPDEEAINHFDGTVVKKWL